MDGVLMETHRLADSLFHSWARWPEVHRSEGFCYRTPPGMNFPT